MGLKKSVVEYPPYLISFKGETKEFCISNVLRKINNLCGWMNVRVSLWNSMNILTKLVKFELLQLYIIIINRAINLTLIQ